MLESHTTLVAEDVEDSKEEAEAVAEAEEALAEAMATTTTMEAPLLRTQMENNIISIRQMQVLTTAL